MIVRLHAPMAGWALDLAQVPDPVFAERMMGEGFAIDPLDGVIRAPCDATVIAVAPTRHSVTLKLANGAELLIHVGLETVALAGDGFTARVRDGDAVDARPGAAGGRSRSGCGPRQEPGDADHRHERGLCASRCTASMPA